MRECQVWIWLTNGFDYKFALWVVCSRMKVPKLKRIALGLDKKRAEGLLNRFTHRFCPCY